MLKPTFMKEDQESLLDHHRIVTAICLLINQLQMDDPRIDSESKLKLYKQNTQLYIKRSNQNLKYHFNINRIQDPAPQLQHKDFVLN